jgi:tRNA(Ile2)-agmatinylcytidine synthase
MWVSVKWGGEQSDMYVAFDDTDSVKGMCTTFLATEILDALQDFDLIGYPRLVRLNPAVPWKTRGNGALGLRVGIGAGRRTLIGRIRDRSIYSFSRLAREVPSEAVLEIAAMEMKRWAKVQDDASPGLVVSRLSPDSKFYWQAVRGIVEKEDVRNELRRLGAVAVEMKGGRGVIGATAAMSWRPHDRTYEVLTYRAADRWGTKREIRAEDVEALDRRFPSTFNNYDHKVDRVAIAPHSPCPILFGIRGDVPEDLVEAAATVRSEPKDRWLVFLTNQGTDDHIVRDWRRLNPSSSYEVTGTVSTAPIDMPGRFTLFRIRYGKDGEVDCVAYEPSKGFRQVVRLLVPGDRVRVLGEVRETPRTLNIEKLQVLRLATVSRKVANPLCPTCIKSMQSLGEGAGYRCRKCGAKAPSTAARVETVARALTPGWYEPPVCSRRHLSKPLKRMGYC